MNGLTPQMRVPNPRLLDVVGWMQRFANKGKKDLNIRRLVERVCADLAPGDYASEVLACYHWVCQNVRYMRDVHDVEFLKEPSVTVETQSGDCDDMATLLAAMLMACGNRCSFMLVGFTKPMVPSHVFVVVHTPAGDFPLDPVANRNTQEMLSRATGSTLFPADEVVSGKGIGEQPVVVGQPRPGTMTYSVFDYPSGLYRYYLGQALVLPASGWFRAPAGNRLRAPEALAVRVPDGARLVGEGKSAKGLIGTTQAGLGSVTVNTPRASTSLSLGALAGILPDEVAPSTVAKATAVALLGFILARASRNRGRA